MAAPLIAAAIPAAAAIAGSGAQVYAQGKMNSATRDWNQMMYGIQRRDAMTDWLMQNHYNHPTQQMQRLKEAGLNPNLVYGNGAVANSTSQPRSTDVKSWNPQTPDFQSGIIRAGGAVGDYMDMQIKTQQLENLKAQLANMNLDGAMKGEAIAGKTISNAKSQFELGKSMELRDTAIETAKTNLQLLEQKGVLNTAKNNRESQMAGYQMEKILQDTVRLQLANENNPRKQAIMDAQLENLLQSGKLKAIQARMAEEGVNPNDEFIIRAINDWMHDRGSISELSDYIEKGVKKATEAMRAVQ